MHVGGDVGHIVHGCFLEGIFKGVLARVQLTEQANLLTRPQELGWGGRLVGREVLSGEYNVSS